MRDHLGTLVDDFRRYDREIAVIRYRGNRRRVSTYGEIARLAGRFAALLVQKGIGPGDRVILWAENSAEWIAAFHGCILRGVLAVPLDAFGSADFASRVASDVKPKLAVGDALLLRQLRGDNSCNDFEHFAFEEWQAVLPGAEAGPVEGLGVDTPLQILFTSGTTGDPKGIVHTHGNVLASVGPIEKAAQRYMRYEKFVHPLRFLHTLPLSHVFGQTMGLWIPPIFRAEVHFESRLVATRLIETIHRERISVLAAVPRVFALLKSHLETSRPRLSEQLAAAKGISAWKRWWWFRRVHHSFGFKFWALISGGGTLPPAVEQFWNGLGFVVVQGYGMTETTALITLNHPFHVARGTIGKPLPGREVKIGPDGEVLVRGPMISTSTWSGGQLRKREDDWLATGDLAEREPTGELRFLGRKSEVIVTGSGVNIHPEDLEAEIEEHPGVTACAVVSIDTPAGPEPCAVLAIRGSAAQAGAAIENANAQLAEFQRVRRWMLWPELDLPRTSTGKVRRKKVAEWVAETQRGANGSRLGTPSIDSGDWLLALIVEITDEAPPKSDERLRLAEDLHLDSLGRVQLAAAIEEKMGMAPDSGLLEEVQTLGQLRSLVNGHEHSQITGHEKSEATDHEQSNVAGHDFSRTDGSVQSMRALAPAEPSEANRGGPGLASETRGPALGCEFTPAGMGAPPQRTLGPETHARPSRHHIYPHWPWWRLVQCIRAAFIELVMRPLVWLLANPRVVAPPNLGASVSEPILIVANHITAYDGPLVQYALPGRLRRSIAIAMSGEMLDAFRHFRNPKQGSGNGGFFPFGPIAHFLVTALFNVFPLPSLRDFQRSFAHAGEALDRGYHVLLFPEGARSATGELARFRPGIGLLVKQSDTAVLPVALRGIRELKQQRGGWFRSGAIELRVGQPIRFALDATESSITERLQAEVKRLLEGQPATPAALRRQSDMTP